MCSLWRNVVTLVHPLKSDGSWFHNLMAVLINPFLPMLVRAYVVARFPLVADLVACPWFISLLFILSSKFEGLLLNFILWNSWRVCCFLFPLTSTHFSICLYSETWSYFFSPKINRIPLFCIFCNWLFNFSEQLSHTTSA